MTKDEIQTGLGRLEHGLDCYLWLQRHVRLCDVGTNEDFQRSFSGFYRVRRSSQWRAAFFALLESAKAKTIDFPEVLKEINRRTGRVEASFASKLVATLDTSMPVVDKFVMEYFDLRLPRWGLADRELKTIELYRDLCDRYGTFIQSPTGELIRKLFDGRYPCSELSELKKIDLVLWQTRP